MKFKTVEWTIALPVAAQILKDLGNERLAGHVDDLAAWILLHLQELEQLPDVQPEKKRCPHCHEWIEQGWILCPRCRKRQIRRD